MNIRYVIPLHLILSAAVLAAPTASADPVVYSIFQRDWSNASVDYQESDSGGVNRYWSHTSGHHYFQSWARACWAGSGNPFLAVSQRQVQYTTIQDSRRTEAAVNFDVFFQGPPGEFTTSFNIAVAGGVDPSPPASYGKGGFRIEYWDLRLTSPQEFGTFAHPNDVQIPLLGNAGGAFANETGGSVNGIYTSPPITIPASHEIRLQIRLMVDGAAAPGHSVTVSAGELPGSSEGLGISWPQGSPVFNLPDGYTVHIPDLCVEGNVSTECAVAVEPQSWGGVKALYR